MFAYGKIKKRCFQWFKDTKMKTNHNGTQQTNLMRLVVSSGSKIVKIHLI
jgi:hypothetical protein